MRKQTDQIVVVLEEPKRRGLPWGYIAPFAAFGALVLIAWVFTAPGTSLPVPSAPGAQSSASTAPTARPTDNPDQVLAAGQDAINALQERMNAIEVSCSSLGGNAYTACSAKYDALDRAMSRLSDCVDVATTFAGERACESAIPSVGP